MRTGSDPTRRGGTPVAPAFLLLLLAAMLLPSCAGTPERLTRAALSGDGAAMGGLLGSASPAEVNAPFTLPAADPACPGRRALTPLQAAACAGKEDAVRRLLAAKADVDLDAGAGQAPLILAMANGRDGATRLLVEGGARLECKDGSGNTPLLLAAARGRKDLAELLLKNGASPKARNVGGQTALLLSTDAGLSRVLAGLGADPLATTERGETGLHLAARNGNAETARFFLENGVDPFHRNADGLTALDFARGKGGASSSPVAGGGRNFRERGAPEAVARVLEQKMRASARGGAAASSSPVEGAATAPAGGRSEVAALLESWMGGAVRRDLESAEKAASEGRSSDALALYAAALPRAADAGEGAEDDLRLKILRYAASLPQPPGIPEEAREHLVRSQYLIKKEKDVSLVEEEIAAALRIAPWWADGYYNLGVIHAEQGKHDPAERYLRLYLAAAPPGDPRAQDARDRLYEIKMAREEEGKIRGMAGGWVDDRGAAYTVGIEGDRITIRSGNGLSFRLTQRNGAIEGSVEAGSRPADHGCTIPEQKHPVTGRIAPDAKSMTLEYQWNQYKTSFHWVNMAGVPVRGNCLTCSEVCDAVTVSGTDTVRISLRQPGGGGPAAGAKGGGATRGGAGPRGGGR